ncbi:serine/threonine-protein kinase [Herbiconiux liangxiaofengii]|uniref:serine/threonine-protein kinase n=1 Tax=Herbiconiux liangxiaofengii TaxID=3342795 RepID=UPI0035BA7A24
MHELLADDAPHTGQLLDGRYRLESRAGEGGMATVYRAVDEQLGRTVAIKVFRPGAAETSDLERTRFETRVLASLNHHALVTLYDARVEDTDHAYLAMEFVDGPTLRARIAEGPVPPADVAAMAFDLAEALHVVHDGGVVHRDIKPSNVLLRPSRTPGPAFRATLADFGIAYLLDSTRVTLPGTIMGTAAYLSPEQVRGAAPAPAADVYALGLLLLESLTGRRAFPQTATHESLMARVSSSPVIPGELGYRWKSLLTAMTATRPEQRPTALEVAVAARAIQLAQHAAGDGAGDDGTDDADATGAIAVTSAGRGDAAAPTLKSPAPTAPTRVAPAVAGPTAPTLVAAVAPDAAPATPTRRSRRHTSRARTRLLAVFIGLPAAAVVIAIAVVLGLSAIDGPAAPATPVLPSLEQPLQDDLQQLLDEVSP